jgi:uncharacterized membrane protein
MAYLILGLILWIGSHLFKRLMPEARARMGNAGKGLVTVLSFAALGLIIWGYRSAEFIDVWTPPSWTVHLNNLLMLVAVFFLALSHSKGRLRARFRHPMLGAVKIWAVAHLLVNGDLASILLFGGMLAWAVVSVILINRAEPWVPPQPGEPKKDVVAVVMTLVAYGVIVGIHMALGVSPFPG